MNNSSCNHRTIDVGSIHIEYPFVNEVPFDRMTNLNSKESIEYTDSLNAIMKLAYIKKAYL